MKVFLFCLVCFLVTNLFAQRITVNDTAKHFEVDGKRIWLSGTNTPWDNWNDFGGDFDYNWWKTEFQKLSVYNINSTRVWITCDGQNPSIQIDTSGYISGVSDAFWEDVDSLMAITRENRIYLMIALISFDHFKEGNQNYQTWRKMINNEENRQSFVDNYAVPFVNRYKNNPYFFAVDVGNELDGVWDWDGFKLPSENVLDLVKKTVDAVHSNSEVLACQGLGTGIKYNSSENGGSGNYLADIDVDFYDVHYYDWQNPFFSNPFDKSPAHYKIDNKPCIIGEAVAKGSAGYSALDCYKKIYAKGWQGFMPWTSNGVDINGNKDDSAPGSNWFFDTHPDLVYPGSYLSVTLTDVIFSPKSGNRKVSISSNVGWTVSDDQDWITVNPETGSDNDTLTIIVQENTGNNIRTGKVTVTDGDIKRIISISQNGLGQGEVQKIPIGNFDSGSLDPFVSWGAPLSIVANPDGTPEDSVALLDQSAGAWNGIAGWWENGDLFTEADSISVNIYANAQGSIKFYCDNSLSGGANFEQFISGVPAKTWTTYTVKVSDMPVVDYQQFAVQYDQADLIYFDNFTLYKTSSKDKNVIFDPATYPEDSLAEGMEIVEIEGKKYLQVIVDEWEQTVHLADSVIIPLGIEKISFDIMYASGTSGLDINNAWYKYLFQSPEGIELFNAEGDANTVKKLTSLVTDCNGKIGSSNGLYISSLLIAGQNKSGWVAVSGDTVWIGKTSFVEPTNMNSDDPNVNAPLSYELAQNYPNPFNPSTTISYSLPAREMVELVIYDTLGRKIATLVNEPKESGRHRVEFENPELSSGAYFYCFKAGNYVDTKKMVFLK